MLVYDTELLPLHEAEQQLLIRGHAVDDHILLGGGKPHFSIDVPNLLRLLFRHILDLPFLLLGLGVKELLLRFRGQIGANTHRDGSRHDLCHAGQKEVAALSNGAGNSRQEADGRHQAVVHPENNLPDHPPLRSMPILVMMSLELIRHSAKTTTPLQKNLTPTPPSARNLKW